MKLPNYTRTMLKGHEGLSLMPYICPAGYLTIGWGHNLEAKGISRRIAILLLEEDIKECVSDLLTIFPERYNELPGKIQTILINMRFQLGPSRFRGFKKMIAAVHEYDLRLMIKEMLDSKWAKEDTPERAAELAKIVESEIQI